MIPLPIVVAVIIMYTGLGLYYFHFITLGEGIIIVLLGLLMEIAMINKE